MTALLWRVAPATGRAQLLFPGTANARCGARARKPWTAAGQEPRCPACLRRANLTPVTDVLAETGASYRRLDYWTRIGLLKPTEPTSGSGSRRNWDPAELAVARRMVDLIAAGLSLQAAHHAARHDGALPGGRWRIHEDGTR